MLHRFIVDNRQAIIDGALRRSRKRAVSTSAETKLADGIPLFLTQLAGALAPLASPESEGTSAPRAAGEMIGESAARHGHELLRDGFTVAQVVHGYGDVCQVVTELAVEKRASISPEDFRVFNRCLDDAIAGAVTAHARQRERDLAYEGTERLAVFAHEVRNLLGTAVLSFDILKRGIVGLGGSTGGIHARSLAGLAALVERALAEVRLQAANQRLERISVAELIEELEMSAALHAAGNGLGLIAESSADGAVVYADRQLLASAVSNLLQNAFKFTRAGGQVVLAARATADQVFIDVRDECGGLSPGQAGAFFKPFAPGDSDRAGLGLGLSIALSAVRANSGDISVRDVPGTGCVFTISLPRPPDSGSSTFHVLRDGDPRWGEERGRTDDSTHSELAG